MAFIIKMRKAYEHKNIRSRADNLLDVTLLAREVNRAKDEAPPLLPQVTSRFNEMVIKTYIISAFVIYRNT